MGKEIAGLRRFWYPVAADRLLERGPARQPIERTIAGVRVAVFRDAHGHPRVLDARCPHRGMSLARGRIVDNCLECPYHGWRFDPGGRCVRIPSQAPEARIRAGADARAYPVVVRHGLVWTYVGEPAEEVAPVPTFAGFDDPELRELAIEEPVAGGIEFWIENFIDISHVPFVHARTFGGRRPQVEHHGLERHADGLGFSSRVVVEYDYSLLGRVMHGSLDPYVEDLRFEHRTPVSMVTIDIGKGRTQKLLLACAPEDETTSRAYIVVRRSYLQWVPFGDQIGAYFTREVIREDSRIARGIVAPSTPQSARGASAAADASVLEASRLLRLHRDRDVDAGNPVALPRDLEK